MTPLKSDTTRWFSEELNPHGPALRAYLQSQFPTVADIENLVQESLMRVLAVRAKNRVASAKALLFSVGRNLARDTLRRQRLVSFESMTQMAPSFAPTDGTDIVESVSRQQELTLLREAIRALPPRCCQVVTLRTSLGCSQREIAERLGISENAVEKQLANGVRLCAAYFSERGLP